MLPCNFLNLGETFRSLSFQYRIGERTISGIVEDTCQAIVCSIEGEIVEGFINILLLFYKTTTIIQKI